MRAKGNFGLPDYISLGKQLRGQILADAKVNSCIETSAATIDTLKHIGLDAYALSVTCVVTNRPLWEFADAHGYWPELGTEEYPIDGYAVGVGLASRRGPVPEVWPGHLVVIAERKWLLDFSLDQANRPDYGMEVGAPVVISVDEAFLRGSCEKAFLVVQKDNARLHYQTRMHDRSYRDTAGWTTKRPVVQFTKRK